MNLIEKILVYSLPLGTFETIIESVSKTKAKYAPYDAN